MVYYGLCLGVLLLVLCVDLGLVVFAGVSLLLVFYVLARFLGFWVWGVLVICLCGGFCLGSWDCG